MGAATNLRGAESKSTGVGAEKRVGAVGHASHADRYGRGRGVRSSAFMGGRVSLANFWAEPIVASETAQSEIGAVDSWSWATVEIF